MANETIQINRAPVFTLWAAIVAERLGHNRDTALTLGKALAGLNAQSKGKRLGIYGEAEDRPGKPKARAEKTIELMGWAIPVIKTKEGLRAASQGEAIQAASVQRYLDSKFGESLPHVRNVMEALARAYPPRQLAAQAYPLYESFRPKIPEGTKGWGAKGVLNLSKIKALASRGR
jgi:hypothetical protein